MLTVIISKLKYLITKLRSAVKCKACQM